MSDQMYPGNDPQQSTPQLPPHSVPSAHEVPQQPYPQQAPQQPYPEQPYPQQAQPHPEQYQYAAMHQPQLGAPFTPPTNPQKKGLPAAGWIGIGVGAFLLLVVIVGSIFASIWALGISSSKPSAPVLPDEYESEPFVPEAQDEVTLDDSSNFSAGPYWAIPFESGWDVVRFDQDGYNEMKSESTGCSFLTFQGLGPEGLTATNDRDATEETVPTALQIGLPWNTTGSPEVLQDGTAMVEVDWAYTVEMQRYAVTYPATDGTERTRQMLLRVFLPQGTAMYAEVDCPATISGDSEATRILEGLSLSEF